MPISKFKHEKNKMHNACQNPGDTEIEECER